MKTILEIAVVTWIISLMAVTVLGIVTEFYGEFKASEFYHDFFEKRGDTE